MSAILVAIITVVGGGLAAYIAAARKMSGKIGTSEASKLWDESTNMRQEYRDEIEKLRALLAEFEKRVDVLETNNTDLRTENAKLRSTIDEHEETIAGLQSQVDNLTKANAALVQENADLQVRISGLEA